MLSVAATFAQGKEKTTSSFPRIWLRVGYCTSTVHGANFDGKWKSGVNVGIVADCAMSESWLLRPGVHFTMKGFQKGSAPDINYKSEFNYIEVPIPIVYQKSIGQTRKFELQTGPYFSYGVSGKSDKRTASRSSFDYYNYYNTFDNFKRFDWGINAGAGVIISNIYIGASYDFGFVSIIRHALNHCFMVNVGYSF